MKMGWAPSLLWAPASVSEPSSRASLTHGKKQAVRRPARLFRRSPESFLFSQLKTITALNGRLTGFRHQDGDLVALPALY